MDTNELPENMDAYELWERYGQQGLGDATYYIFDNGYAAAVIDNEADTMFHLKLLETTPGGLMTSTVQHRYAGPLGGMYRMTGKAEVLNAIRHLPARPPLPTPLPPEDEDLDMDTETSCKALAALYASMLVTKERDDTSTIYIVSANAPAVQKERLTDLIHEVGDRMYGSAHFPPDALWDDVRSVLLVLEDSWDLDEVEMPVDVYTHKLNTWMITDSSHRDAVWELLTESVSSGGYGTPAKIGFDSMDEAIMVAQHEWLRNVAEIIKEIIEEHAVEAEA